MSIKRKSKGIKKSDKPKRKRKGQRSKELSKLKKEGVLPTVSA